MSLIHLLIHSLVGKTGLEKLDDAGIFSFFPKFSLQTRYFFFLLFLCLTEGERDDEDTAGDYLDPTEVVLEAATRWEYVYL